MKKWLPNLLLLAISVTLTLVVAELGLRAVLYNSNAAFDFIRKPQLYANYERDVTEHLYKEDYWKMRFLFSGASDMKEPHPLLGWDGNFDSKTYEHADEYFSKGKRPVLLFGDSFSQCISSTKCFEDYLNADTTFTNRFYLLNFGVGGYGLDQIHLLMEQALKRFDNPIVIFGMLTTDLDRSMLSFRDAPKPHFKLRDGELELQGTPIELGASEYIENHPIKPFSYVLSILRNVTKWLLNSSVSEERQKSITELNKAIIHHHVTELRNKEIEPLMLLFQPIHQSESEWRKVFLLGLFQDLNLEVINARSILLTEMNRSGKAEEEFFIPNDLHPNSAYNKIIAEEIKKAVQGID